MKIETKIAFIKFIDILSLYLFIRLFGLFISFLWNDFWAYREKKLLALVFERCMVVMDVRDIIDIDIDINTDISVSFG